MKRFKIFLLFLALPMLMIGQEIDENILQNATYLQRMQEFKKHPLQEGQIVFFGNSITQAGKWNIYFPLQKPANRGISGDNTDGMLSRMHDVIAAKPKKLFLMAGVNDISLQRDNSTIIRQVRLMIRQIQAGSPDTEIYLQSVLPLNAEKLTYTRLKGKEIQIENYNTLLKQLCNEFNITYVDVYSSLLEKPLTLKSEYTQDGLHINEAAYKVWVNLIKQYVEK